MAAFAFACPLEPSRAWRPGPGTESAVHTALGERSPGAPRALAIGHAWCAVAGADALLDVREGTLVVADGRPVGLDAERWRASGGGLALLPGLDGGFALVACDTTACTVTLARDRFGARPLAWAVRDGVLYAASEGKVLAALGVPHEFCRETLDEVLLCRWVQGECAFLAPYRQVRPASFVVATGGVVAPSRRYWHMAFEPESGGPEAMDRWRDLTRTAMRTAIAGACDGRATVGVLLSGGIDSSVIAAVAREAASRVICYVARLPDDGNPELERALGVARHLGIECHVVDVAEPDVATELRAHLRRFEEPTRHPNNFVLRQLYERAREDVDLLLQGDGAEMTFGLADVKRVARFKRKHDLLRVLPQGLRLAAARALWNVADSRAGRLANLLAWDEVTYAARLDTVGYRPAVQRTLRHLSAGRPTFLPFEYFAQHDDFSDALQAYQMDTFTTVSLVRHDRLSQPCGVACESPFLRAPVVDVALRLPRALRYVGQSKPVLRALCDFYLPPEVSRAPKLGFPVPWERWVKRAVAGGVPRSAFLAGVLPEGFLEAALATQDAEALWTVLTLQAMAEEFGLSA